jgi:hypothetical protein
MGFEPTTPCLQTVRLGVVMAPGLVVGVRRRASVDLVRSVRVARQWPERVCLQSTPTRPWRYIRDSRSAGRKGSGARSRSDQSISDPARLAPQLAPLSEPVGARRWASLGE